MLHVYHLHMLCHDMCVYAFTHAGMYIDACVHVHVYTYECTYTCITSGCCESVCECTYVCVYVCMHICMCVYTYVSMCLQQPTEHTQRYATYTTTITCAFALCSTTNINTYTQTCRHSSQQMHTNSSKHTESIYKLLTSLRSRKVKTPFLTSLTLSAHVTPVCIESERLNDTAATLQ
jgi:hypothetical protein